MKVYIINFHHVLNYGAVIQGYALCKFLIKNGYDAKIIDYRPFYFLSQTYRPAKGFMKTIKKAIMNLNFYKFRKEHFKLSQKILYTEKDLINFFKDSKDAFICGSDQVWNAKLTNGRMDPGYFLDFVPKTAKKISYAASIGHTRFDSLDTKNLLEKLNSYHAISVREDFAKEEVIKISGKDIIPKVVLDPTLILDDYSEILDFSLVPNEEYLVVYTTENSNSFRKYVKLIKDILKIQVFNLGHYKLGKYAVDYVNIHPSKWLGLFSKATYVCTNSFHGTAFSIVFKRNFSVLGRETKKDLNTRQLTLLTNLGIENRFINELKEFDQVNHLSDINYNHIKDNFDRLVGDSRTFLLDALSKK